jgi:type II secretory pathway component PulJ
MNRGTAMKGAALAASLSIASIASIASAQQPESTREQLQQELEQLQARIAKLESRDVQQAAAAPTKQDVLTDAEKRSTLGTAMPLTAGYDKGFFIKSEDGTFLLKPGAVFQFRYVANLSEDAGGDDHIESGFELRRTRFRFDGNAFSKDFTYSFVWDANRSGGAVSLLDAWAAYRFAPQWSVKFGQFKESWEHEKDVPFTNQLAVERSLVDAVIGGNQTDRVQGISLLYGGGKDDDVRAELAVTDGANSKNTNFENTPAGDWGVGFRGEYKLAGDWANYRDFTAKGTKDQLLVLGTGADFTQAGDLDILRATADAQWKNTHGLSLYGAVNGLQTDTGGAGDGFDWGALAQVGYLLNKKVELFGRYDILQLDDVVPGDEDTFNEFTIGANYYLGPDGAYLHRAKLTFDVVYLPDGAPSAQTGLGILGSDEDQFVFRGQFLLQI